MVTCYIISPVLIIKQKKNYLELILRKRLCVNVYRRPSISSFLRKSVGSYLGRGSVTSTGVTYELVSNVPDIHSESEWFAELEDSLEEEDEALEETFFEKYAKAVSNVETLISLEKLKQADYVSELLFKQEELQHRMSNNNTLR